MKIGLQIDHYAWPGGPAQIGRRLAEIGRRADQAGFASLWVMDHFFQMDMFRPVDEPMLESYCALSFLAGVTEKVHLGTLVSGVIYRPPALLVKNVSTLDVLSGGRAYFGIGAAWYEREAEGLGFPFPSWRERFERLEETLQIAMQMWHGEVRPYQGKHYTLAESLNCPQPLSQPHPPILIGGMGEKKTLRLVAQYGDACNLMLHAGTEVLRSKLETLKRHCDEVGRPYQRIERTVLGGVDANFDAEAVIGLCRSLADLGFQHFILSLPDGSEMTALERIGQEIIPIVAEF